MDQVREVLRQDILFHSEGGWGNNRLSSTLKYQHFIFDRLQSTLHVPALLPGRPPLHPSHQLLLLHPLLHLHRCHLGRGGACSPFNLLHIFLQSRCWSTHLTHLSASLEELSAFSSDFPSLASLQLYETWWKDFAYRHRQQIALLNKDHFG